MTLRLEHRPSTGPQSARRPNCRPWPPADFTLPGIRPAAGLPDGSSDVAFLRAPVTAPGLRSVRLAAEPRVFVLPAGHPLAARPVLTLADVAGRALGGGRSGPRWQLLDPRPGGDRPVIGAVATTLDEWRELVAAGRGISLCPASAERYYARPGIAFVPAAGVPDAEVRLAWRTGDRTPALSALLDLVDHRPGSPAGHATA